MRVLFIPFGSEGDVNPLLWLADGLAARGDDARVLLSPHYGRLAEARGLPWIPLGTEEDFLEMAADPNLWHRTRGPATVIRGLVRSLPEYRRAFETAGKDFDLVVTSSFALAGSALAEALGIPRLTLHMQPICLRSEFELPLFLPELAALRPAPRWVKRLFFAGMDFFLWSAAGRPLNRFRRELGLPPLRHFYHDAVHGAEAVAALFPDWFAPPQPDWPPQLRQFSFPIHAESAPLPPELEGFLAAGDPPVIWTHGSANLHVARFQERALAVSRELGLRCLLVSLATPPSPLPGFAFHAGHVRFEDLFPRCRAAVHHGGIGTTAKAFAAGLPQLIVPRSHDQPDNGDRVSRLGAGRCFPYHRMASASFVKTLREVAGSPAIRSRCAEFRNRLAAVDPLPSLCDWAAETAGRTLVTARL